MFWKVIKKFLELKEPIFRIGMGAFLWSLYILQSRLEEATKQFEQSLELTENENRDEWKIAVHSGLGL